MKFSTAILFWEEPAKPVDTTAVCEADTIPAVS